MASGCFQHYYVEAPPHQFISTTESCNPRSGNDNAFIFLYDWRSSNFPVIAGECSGKDHRSNASADASLYKVPSFESCHLVKLKMICGNNIAERSRGKEVQWKAFHNDGQALAFVLKYEY